MLSARKVRPSRFLPGVSNTPSNILALVGFKHHTVLKRNYLDWPSKRPTAIRTDNAGLQTPQFHHSYTLLRLEMASKHSRLNSVAYNVADTDLMLPAFSSADFSTVL